jgi:hypothetical protein
MFRKILILAIALSLVSCASRSRLNKFEKDINEIKDQVHGIKVLTEEMRSEIGGMKDSMMVMDSSVKLQSAEIDEQKKHQDNLNRIVDDIRISVEKLETEQIAAKEQQLKEMTAKPEEAYEQPVVVRTVQDGDITKVFADKPKSGAKKSEGGYEVEEYTQSGFGYAVKDGVILWKAPAKKSDVLEILVNWQKLTILGKVKNQGVNWWKVKTDEYTGFVNAMFVIVSD